MRNTLRSFRVLTEDRPKNDLQALLTAFGDANGVASVLAAVPGALGASDKCPGDAFGRLLAALGSPEASQDRLWGDIWASRCRPERVRIRPRSGVWRQKRLEIDFLSIWGRFGMDFRRFLCDEASKSESQKGVG